MDNSIQPKLAFRIEQVALCPKDPARAIELLTKMGAGEWARDHVTAVGRVFSNGGTNEADLAFDYEMLDGAHELEVLHYTDGPNWMQKHGPSVSHIGCHVSQEELLRWRAFFAEEGIQEAQSVRTISHTNPFLVENGRKYQYTIFDTREILGVDVKFICRIDRK